MSRGWTAKQPVTHIDKDGKQTYCGITKEQVQRSFRSGSSRRPARPISVISRDAAGNPTRMGYRLCTACTAKAWPGTFTVAGGGKKHRAGGKARHPVALPGFERSYLRPFGTHCIGCKRPMPGTEHVWHLKGTAEYICDACASERATGGGKKRHAGGGNQMAKKTTKKRCKWFAGILKDGAEVLCLSYTPTESHSPKGWRYAFGPYPTRKKAIEVAHYQGHRVVNETAQEKRTPLRDSPADPGTVWKSVAEVKALLK